MPIMILLYGIFLTGEPYIFLPIHLFSLDYKDGNIIEYIYFP